MVESKRLAICGGLIALSYVSLWFIRIPIFPTASFLRLDIKDVFIAIMGLIYGPFYAFSGSFCIALLQMLSVSEYGFIGFFMNVLSSSAFSLPIAVAYCGSKNENQLVKGLVGGSVCLIITMILWNYLITPLYMGVPREMVRDMLLPVFLPFNVLKGVINSILVFICHSALKRFCGYDKCY